MSDLIDDPAPGENAHEYTVSEISGAVKRIVEGEFGRVRVRGEVGRVFAARSGHLYFDIKDDRAVLAAVSFKGQVARFPVMPEEGMEIVATGKLTTFPSQSKYQLNVDDLRPAGVGALMAMLEKRKKALAAEGLFDEARKKPIPYLPQVIGVVTSPSGAVIRDILHRLRDRFPRKVLLWPVTVQGERCAAEVAAAIKGFNALSPGGAIPRPDLLIVARGGGSIEDLWGFNEEIVARAAAASEIPLISAVGHETDTTLIDYVSDRRAPTPTAAAEMAVPVRMELMAWTEAQGGRLARAATQGVAQRRQRLRDVARALPQASALTTAARQRLDYAAERLPGALRAATLAKRSQLVSTAAVLRPGVLRGQVATRSEALGKLSARLRPALERLLRDQARETHRRRDKLAEASERLKAGWGRVLARQRDRLEALDRLRLTLGYEATLGRGYAVVWDGETLVTTAKAARAAGALEIQFQDGRFAPASGGGAPAPKPKEKKPPPGQGSLF